MNSPVGSVGQGKASSTLLTSPRSQGAFALRLAFFAIAPFGIVLIGALFPVTGTLLGIALALVVFLSAEYLRQWVTKSRLIKLLIGREMEMAMFYHLNPPRPFLYYVFYPLLFPYWLIKKDARDEFLFYRGYTGFGVVFLILTMSVNYFQHWQELGFKAFLPMLGISLLTETILILSLCMPIATSVVHLHQTGRRKRLIALLLVASVSTGAAIAKIVLRRDPIVSFETRHRVRLRTAANAKGAYEAQVLGLRAALTALRKQPLAVDEDGKVEGEPLDLAHKAMQKFYKSDEVNAFDLWASPKSHPRVLVVYFEARQGKPPIWLALKDGVETHDAKQLPRGAFLAMKHAAEE